MSQFDFADQPQRPTNRRNPPRSAFGAAFVGTFGVIAALALIAGLYLAVSQGVPVLIKRGEPAATGRR